MRGTQFPDPEEDPAALRGVRADAAEDVAPRTDADFRPHGDPGTAGI